MQARALAVQKLESLDARIEELERIRRLLAQTLAAWDASLGSSATKPARLLESLAPTTRPKVRS